MDSDFMKMVLGAGLRHVAGGAGAWLFHQGLIDQSGQAQFIGAIMFLGAIAWSWWKKAGAARVAAMLKEAAATAAKTSAAILAAFLILAMLMSPSPADAQGLAPAPVALPAAITAPTVPAPTASTAKRFVNPFAGPYTTAVCGGYYGLNTIGVTSSINNAAVGTQTVQGAIGATVGYGCPINVSDGSFWFVEGMFDFANLNGSTNGLSLSGPAIFVQRVGIGTPINNMLSMFPALGGSNSAAVPALPALPSGVTSGPGAPYLFAALHEQDVSAQIGLSQNRQWMISAGLGLGVLYRLSNGVVADTFAEYKMQTNSICVGPDNTQCAKFGSGVMAGFQLKY